MPPLFKTPQWYNGYKKDKQTLVKEVQADLEGVLNRGGEEGLEFVCEDDIKTIWTPERVQRLAQGLGWDDPVTLHEVREDFRKILSILVWIRWDEWQHFKKFFLDHQNRADRDLPLLNDKIFSSNHLQNEFVSRQFIFIPVILEVEGPYANKPIEYDQRYRMPFLESVDIGEGAGGVVTKELIAVKHFQSAGDGSDLNTRERWVAKKSIKKGDKTGPNEQGNLRFLKQGSTAHDSIMNSYTSFAHGTNFIIISPLAHLDLNKFFHGRYEDFEERKLRFTTFDLLKEAACLADALDFLHYRLRLGDGKRISCAHLDFKPENILVKWTDSEADAMPVGRWYVHDFGISKIKKSSEEETSALEAPGDYLVHFSLTKAQRQPGPFQAPEVQNSKDRVVGRESDMWSFGCLLAVVICFAVGGPESVSGLARSRYSYQQPNRRDDDYFYTLANGKAELKPTVRQFLDSLKTENDKDAWIGETLDVVYKILKDDPNQRLKAAEACVELDAITGKMEQLLRKNCEWATMVPVERLESFHIYENGGFGLQGAYNPNGLSTQERSRGASSNFRPNGRSPSSPFIEDGIEVATHQSPELPWNPARSPNLSTYSDGSPPQLWQSSQPQYPEPNFYPGYQPNYQPWQQYFAVQYQPSFQPIPQQTMHPPYFAPQNVPQYPPRPLSEPPSRQSSQSYHLAQQNPAQHPVQYPVQHPAQHPVQHPTQHLAQPFPQSSSQYLAPGRQTSHGQSRRPSVTPSIIRSDTASSNVIFPSNTNPTSPNPSKSDESSSFGRGSSPGYDISFMHFPTPPNTIKTVVCGVSKRIAFMSRVSVKVYNMNIQNYWVQKKPQKPADQIPSGFFDAQNIIPPEGFQWDIISLSGQYLLLRARSQVECRFFRYFCNTLVDKGRTLEIWTEVPFNLHGRPSSPNQIAKQVLSININLRGDVLFSLNEALFCYTSELGYHMLFWETEGQLRRACFSGDGQRIFAWTLGKSNPPENRWHIWNTSDTRLKIMTKSTRRVAAGRIGSGKNGLIFPLANYFAAFEIPDRIYIVAKDTVNPQISQLTFPVDSIVSGASYEVTESQQQGLVLIQGQQSSSKVMKLPFIADIQGSVPLKAQKLQEGFNYDTNGVAVVMELNSTETFFVVSHPNGLIERRKILS